MDISNLLTDDEVLAEFGRRLEQTRLGLELTQARLAANAGVSKRTVERIENGQSAQLASLIRVLRALDLLSNLELALPKAQKNQNLPASSRNTRKRRVRKKPVAVAAVNGPDE